MKAEYAELDRGFGEIRLYPETLDDIWHLEHLISPGDLVFATTFRSVETAQDKIRPEKPEKRPVRLGIRVEKVEFHRYADRLRLTGIIEHGPETGSYHTLNIEPGFEISVIRKWSAVDLERIDRAVKASVHGVLHILAIEEGEAALFRLRQYGPEEVASVVSGTGKGEDSGGRAGFFERVLSLIAEVRGPLVVAGPGFVKEDFLKYARTRAAPAIERVVVTETRRSGAGAVQEVIGLGVPEKITGEVQLSREVKLMEELLARVAKDLPVAYGKAAVARAVDYGAVEQVLVADTEIRDPAVIDLSDRAEARGARIVVFSTEFEPGRQLQALGGIAALLRFRVE
ncbi:MAG: mRNA surveillance protein pelota [Methanoregulaceae archaeon]|nr:mRNA surveillance protein pelota [Methanoregulaceae archaeon]